MLVDVLQRLVLCFMRLLQMLVVFPTTEKEDLKSETASFLFRSLLEQGCLGVRCFWWPHHQGGFSLFLRTQIIFLGSASLILNMTTPVRMKKGLAGDQFLREVAALGVPAPQVLFALIFPGCPLNYLYSRECGNDFHFNLAPLSQSQPSVPRVVMCLGTSVI